MHAGKHSLQYVLCAYFFFFTRAKTQNNKAKHWTDGHIAIKEKGT